MEKKYNNNIFSNLFIYKMWLQNIIESIYIYSPSLFDLSVCILTNETDTPFILSDNPVLSINYIVNDNVINKLNNLSNSKSYSNC